MFRIISIVAVTTATELLTLSDFSELTSSSAAAQAVATQTQSLTYTFIKLEFITLFGIAGLGYLYMILRWYRRRDFDLTILAIASGGFVVLAAAFAPVDILGIARTSMIVGVAVISIAAYLAHRVEVPDAALSIILAVMLLMNLGVYGAVVGERTPQPNLQRGSVEQAHSLEYYHYRSGWATDAEVSASEWVLSHTDPTTRIYAPDGAGGFQSYFSYTSPDADRPPGNVHQLSCQTEEAGVLYLNKYATDTGVAMSEDPSWFAATRIPLPMTNRSKFYANGDAESGTVAQNESLC